MSETATTPYSNQCNILGDLWIEYKNDEEFSDFISYNDLGLPLAYAVSGGIIESSPLAEGFITETFSLLISALEITDEGFESLADVLIASGRVEI
jgi:hypothetical protein